MLVNFKYKFGQRLWTVIRHNDEYRVFSVLITEIIIDKCYKHTYWLQVEDIPVASVSKEEDLYKTEKEAVAALEEWREKNEDR